jgi:hypothetical protein
LAGTPFLRSPPPPPKVDYSDPASWLCRPGRSNDVCGRSNQDATLLRADGSTSIERFRADPGAPIDWFYVYPTVSTDPGGNASMKIEEQEVVVVNQQFARFASVCRPYAPLYRQVTLTALRAALAGHPFDADRALAYADVEDAWNHYLAHDNHGRAVVPIGHSQGSLILAELVKREIDGKPVQSRILSVILAGYRLQVPVGKDVGGDFKFIPLCRSAGQTGCAINFASFRADSPPPADARLFGVSSGSGLEAACVNPAAGPRAEVWPSFGADPSSPGLGKGKPGADAIEPDRIRAWSPPNAAKPDPTGRTLLSSCSRSPSGRCVGRRPKPLLRRRRGFPISCRCRDRPGRRSRSVSWKEWAGRRCRCPAEG